MTTRDPFLDMLAVKQTAESFSGYVPHKVRDARARAPFPVKPPPAAPKPPPMGEFDFALVFAKLDDLTARCNALIARNGRHTRYVTGE